MPERGEFLNRSPDALVSTVTDPAVRCDVPDDDREQLGRQEWLARLADRLGVEPPTAEEVDDLLALAGVAAHASERTAAPVSCWLAATAGVDPAEARRLAAELADELAGD